MGDALVRLYEHAVREGGLQAKMRLAIKPGVPQPKAAVEPDSPDLVARFRAAIREITGAEAPVLH